jgi:ABC-type multidrug transport system ATPase subunit
MVCEELIQKNKEGTTLVLSSEVKEDILKMCNQIIIMEDGKIKFDQTLNENTDLI